MILGAYGVPPEKINVDKNFYGVPPGRTNVNQSFQPPTTTSMFIHLSQKKKYVYSSLLRSYHLLVSALCN
jgi:hypothetical protein